MQFNLEHSAAMIQFTPDRIKREQSIELDSLIMSKAFPMNRSMNGDNSIMRLATDEGHDFSIRSRFDILGSVGFNNNDVVPRPKSESEYQPEEQEESDQEQESGQMFPSGSMNPQSNVKLQMVEGGPGGNSRHYQFELNDSPGGSASEFYRLKYPKNGRPKQNDNICTSLKAITSLVINIIRAKKYTSHKYISRKLIQLEERATNCAVTRAQEECIKRRVYDVLNALEPMNIIRKNGKLICPSNINELMERDNLIKEIETGLMKLNQKALNFAAMKLRLQAVRKLLRRNKEMAEVHKSFKRVALADIRVVPKDSRTKNANPEEEREKLLENSEKIEVVDLAILMDAHDMLESTSTVTKKENE